MIRIRRPLASPVALVWLALACADPARPPADRLDDVEQVVPNDNRVAGGRTRRDLLEVRLTARLAAWKPDLDVDTFVTVQAFAGADGVPRIPGPLLRAAQGTRIRITIANAIPDSTLVVHGLRAGTVADDTVHVPPHARRSIEFRAGEPGTYLYWGTTSGHTSVGDRYGRDTQLTGAIVIDARDARPDPDERIFVMTVIDIAPDTLKPPPHEDIWELAINGLSWPHSERLEYDVGETVRWQVLNGSYLSHPMHLHGFHFRVHSKGDGVRDVHYDPDDAPDVVTEFMAPGSTFAMTWTPTRAGNWLFHCHMTPHITPFPERAAGVRAHDTHDVAQHALDGMAGLVLGIRTVDRTTSEATAAPVPDRRLRLFVQQARHPADRELQPSGYVLQQDGDPARDSVLVPGPPLLVTRGETAAITVINRSDEHTTVHWHGIELESVYDGVAGWSGLGTSLAPLIAPGDSFTVTFSPPRAGTYIYHTHMEETAQLGTGMYGALLVLEPGERFDPATDLLFVAGRAVDNGVNGQALNGRHAPSPRRLRAGTTYRFRIINILPAAPLELELLADATTATWRPIAKDGAALPAARQREGPARLHWIGVGETYDFLWTPVSRTDAVLELRNGRDGILLRQPLLVR